MPTVDDEAWRKVHLAHIASRGVTLWLHCRPSTACLRRRHSTLSSLALSAPSAGLAMRTAGRARFSVECSEAQIRFPQEMLAEIDGLIEACVGDKPDRWGSFGSSLPRRSPRARTSDGGADHRVLTENVGSGN